MPIKTSPLAGNCSTFAELIEVLLAEPELSEPAPLAEKLNLFSPTEPGEKE